MKNYKKEVFDMIEKIISDQNEKRLSPLRDEVLMKRLEEKYCSVLTLADEQLIEQATQKLSGVYHYGRCHLVAAGIGQSGRIYFGRHMYTEVKECSVCAEKNLIHTAIEADDQLTVFVTVLQQKPEEGGRLKIVPPCGSCREFILTYAPDSGIIVQLPNQKIVKICSVELIHLLPYHLQW